MRLYGRRPELPAERLGARTGRGRTRTTSLDRRHRRAHRPPPASPPGCPQPITPRLFAPVPCEMLRRDAGRRTRPQPGPGGRPSISTASEPSCVVASNRHDDELERRSRPPRTLFTPGDADARGQHAAITAKLAAVEPDPIARPVVDLARSLAPERALDSLDGTPRSRARPRRPPRSDRRPCSGEYDRAALEPESWRASRSGAERPQTRLARDAPVAQGIERCPAEAEVARSNRAGRIRPHEPTPGTRSSGRPSTPARRRRRPGTSRRT